MHRRVRMMATLSPHMGAHISNGSEAAWNSTRSWTTPTAAAGSSDKHWKNQDAVARQAPGPHLVAPPARGQAAPRATERRRRCVQLSYEGSTDVAAADLRQWSLILSTAQSSSGVTRFSGNIERMMMPASTGTPLPNLHRREHTPASRLAPNADVVPTFTRRCRAARAIGCGQSWITAHRPSVEVVVAPRTAPGDARRSCCLHLWFLARLLHSERVSITSRTNLAPEHSREVNGCALLFNKDTFEDGTQSKRV